MSNRKFIELLSPARNLECGIEAIRHGADAVYIGAPRFGARVAAGNSVEDIAELVRFAHPFGVKIYVTVNTLLYDEELPAAQALINDLAAIGVDALITQDPRITSKTNESHEANKPYEPHDPHKIISPIPLHSSTQMDNRTIADVRARLEAGYEQTVLARELSLEDIRAIHEAVPEMPLEAFVHGALCVSYSGRCYASEYCFGRSANRGECAQFCRLPFDLIDADGKIVTVPEGSPEGPQKSSPEGSPKSLRQRHLLSLRDMNRAADLEAMMDAGISSFKIEGRLKDVSYVKNITAYYRQRIDAILERRSEDYCRSSYGTSTITFTPNPSKSFNRGFADYFLHGRTPDMANFATPKSIGEPVGIVKTLSGPNGAAIHNGDGLCFFDADGRLQGFRVNRVDEQGRIHPADPSIMALMPPGAPLYRNLDAAFERELSRPSADRRIPVRWLLEDTEEGFRLELNTPSQRASLLFPYPHELARTPQADNIRRQLMRLGDTPYTCTETDITIRFSDNWFLPASVLGEWRRKVVAEKTLSPLPRKGEGFATAHELRASLPPSLTGSEGICGLTECQSALSDRSRTPLLRTGKAGGGSLMTCRYCLRHALGYCTRDGRRLPFREPLRLRLSDGRTFPLRFDCKTCEMQVLKEL